ncbi:MAG TPA: cytochrome c biogenesis protein ResB [Terriglobales bacterium]|nr:cytochrome c biogenesis protein ResB [Terriglobales bacterium]
MAGSLARASRKFWQTVSSIKTGVILLILVVIVSAAGTIILQRPVTEPDEMQRAYSPQMLQLLDALGLTDIFHAWWFVLLLVAVSFSIVAASIERFPNAWRYVARPYKSTDEIFRKALPNQVRLAVRDEAFAIAAAERAFRRMHLKPERVTSEHRTSLYAEKHRISEFAVYIVHASLLLIFLGGIVDAVWGWRGFISLTRGETSNQVQMRDGSTRVLPIAIRCEAAGQENYTDGSPKKWWSKLVVVDAGRDTLRKEIVVNDPLVYGGIRFYQSSYGMTGKVDKLVLNATSDKAGTQEISLNVDEVAQLDPDTTVKFAEFIPDYVVRDGQIYTRSTQVDNPAAHLIVESRKSGKSVNYWIPAIEGFEQNAASPYKFEPKDLKMAYFTGLQVSHEPGQWAVWAGVILMGLGLAIVFYLVHTRFWATVVHDANGTLQLWVGGAANKNKDVFEHKFRKLVEEIQSELKQQKETCIPEHEHEPSLAGVGNR